jgi:hypothetical protein
MIKFTALLASMLLQNEVKAQECDSSIEAWLDDSIVVPNHQLEVACTSLDDDEDCDCYPENFINWDGANCGRRGIRQCPPENYFSSAGY